MRIVRSLGASYERPCARVVNHALTHRQKLPGSTVLAGRRKAKTARQLGAMRSEINDLNFGTGFALERAKFPSEGFV
jgi:hypothetical protein